jgi:hypothetical protein
MTLTNINSCGSIRVSSDYLEDLRLSQNDVTEIILQYTNSSGVVVDYTVLVGDITSDYMDLDPEFFGYTTEKLPDGVFCFTMTVTQDVDEIVLRQSIVLDCTLKCTLATYIWNDPQSQMHAKYEAIKFYIDCNTCDCETAKLLYDDLVAILDDPTILNNDCGC